ncbi:MAG: hypothetical protein U0905_10940 [Pirellulales bacterium]
MWCDLVWDFSKYFGKCYAAGKPVKPAEGSQEPQHRLESRPTILPPALPSSFFYHYSIFKRFQTTLCLAVRAFPPIQRHFRVTSGIHLCQSRPA